MRHLGTGKLDRSISIMFKGILGSEIADLELGVWRLERFSLRGKLWSIEEERQLRELVSQGLGITEISQVMGKPRLCVKGKVYNLGLSVVVAAGSQHTVAATAAATSCARY